MKFSLIVKSKPDRNHAVFPQGLQKAVENLLEANGFQLALVVPESLMSKRVSGMLEIMMKVKENKDGKHLKGSDPQPPGSEEAEYQTLHKVPPTTRKGSRVDASGKSDEQIRTDLDSAVESKAATEVDQSDDSGGRKR